MTPLEPSAQPPPPIPPFPAAPIGHWLRPFTRFTEVEASSGVLLLICTVVALFAANSPFAESFHSLWNTRMSLSLGGFELDWTLEHWVNDALMTIFFFVVGLEIKREFAVGQLRDPRQAALPIAAALGGMLVPAALYLALQYGEPGERGWGVPVATDIAFVVGALALLGSRVPHGLKILLLALAIVDDIGAILVIAVGYSEGVQGSALAVAALGFGLCALMNRAGVRWIPAYVAVGSAIWLAFVQSGVHPTVCGVLLGLMTPTSAWIADERFLDVVGLAAGRVRAAPWEDHEARREELVNLADQARETVSPLERLELSLHPWVAFGVMPLFALANAGVHLQADQLADSVALAVALGLVVGKPLGIVAISWLAVRTGLARLPDGVNWSVMAGAGCLAGIGFTMSLFVANLAFAGELLEASKVGILVGSALAALLGAALLVLSLPATAGSSPPERERD